MINYIIIKREGNDWSRKKGVYEIQQVEGGDTQEGQQTRRMETLKKCEGSKILRLELNTGYIGYTVLIYNAL